MKIQEQQSHHRFELSHWFYWWRRQSCRTSLHGRIPC